MIAEKWRTVSQQVRHSYDAKAAAINEAEDRKFQNLIVQTQHQQQQQQQQQQLKMQQNQHRKQQMMLYHQQQRQAIRERLYPGKIEIMSWFDQVY